MGSSSSSFKDFLDIGVNQLKNLSACSNLIDDAIDLISKSNLPIITSGVGKSEFIARKLVASLRSISTPSIFLSPIDILHGDAGQLLPCSICVLVSKSGNSRELINIIPVLLDKDIQIITVTNNPESFLAKNSVVVLPISNSHEGDNDNLLPLWSCIASSVICDFIVAKMYCEKGFTPVEFNRNHRGGQIGSSLVVKLSNLTEWRRRNRSVNPETPIVTVLLEISQLRTGLVPVVDAELNLLGIITDGDIRRSNMKNIDTNRVTASDVMNICPTILRDHITVKNAIELLNSSGQSIYSAPVVDQFGKFQGIVTIHDLISIATN